MRLDKKEIVKFWERLLRDLLKHQKSNGEFGKFRVNKVAEVARSYHDKEKLLDKPNTFITMVSMELLQKLNESKYKNKIRSALDWMHSKFWHGWFMSWTTDEPVNKFIPGKEIYYKIKVYRHTAEALFSFIRFEGVSNYTNIILDNLLSVQNVDGGWGNTEKIGESRLLATAYCTQLLYELPLEKVLSLYDPEIRRKRHMQIQNALNAGIKWIKEKNNECNGFWYSPDVSEGDKFFYTGIILTRLGHILVNHCPNLVERVVQKLTQAEISGTWTKDEMKDFDSTARVTAGLITLKKIGFAINQDIIECSQECLFNHFVDEEEIDPVTILFLLQIFWPIKEEIASEKWFSSFKDCLKYALEVRRPYEKGEALENLVIHLFSSIEGLNVIHKRARGRTGEIDIILENESTAPFWRELGSPIFVECKNWAKKVGVDQVKSFADDMREKGIKTGTIFAMGGISGGRERRDANAVVVNNLEKGRLLIIVTRSDLEKIASGEDPTSVFKKKKNDVYSL